MPTYMLDGAGKATLPRRPITVMVNVEGARSASGPVTQTVQLQALRNGSPDPSAVHPQPSLMVLPRVADRVVVRVVPPAGSPVFPTPTVVHAAFGVDSRSDPDAERAVLTAVDLSGLTHWDLAAVELAGDRLTVSSLKTVTDERLGELASAARVSARRIFGADRAGAADACTVVVAVDASASMAGVIEDGTVQAAVELITGVADVTAAGSPVRACLLAEPTRWVPEVPRADLGTATVLALQESLLGTGFHAAASEPAAADGATLTYIVTDGVPADLAALEAGAGSPSHARHLVSLLSEAAWEVQHVHTSVPATRVEPPPPGMRADEHLLRSPNAIDTAVRGLAATALDPGAQP